MPEINFASYRACISILLLAFATTSCVSQGQISLRVSVDSDASIPVRPGVFGVHGELMWGRLYYSDERLAALYKEAGFTNIRFPGGTTANYYNPQTGLYECEGARTEKSVTRIAAFNRAAKKIPWGYTTKSFLKFLEQTNTEFGLVVNVACRTPASTRQWLTSIRDAGHQISFAEMGNELNFPQYSWAFKNSKEYLSASTKHARVVSETSPDTSLGVIMSNAVFTSDESPDSLLSREPGWRRHTLDFIDTAPRADFADAVIVHLYGRPEGRQPDQPDDFLEGYSNAVAHFDVRFPVLIAYIEENAPKKEIWLTEWGVVPRRDRNENLDLRRSPLYGLYIANALGQYLLTDSVTIANFHNMLDLWNQRRQEPRTWLRDLFSAFGESISKCDRIAPAITSGGLAYPAPLTSFTGKASEIQTLYFTCGSRAHLYLINKMNHSYSLEKINVSGRHATTLHSRLFDARRLGPAAGWTKPRPGQPATLPPYSILRLELETNQ